jgi:hypothetical protein
MHGLPPNGQGGYYPAHMLLDWSLERAGRVEKVRKAAEGAALKEAARLGVSDRCSDTANDVVLHRQDRTEQNKTRI